MAAELKYIGMEVTGFEGLPAVIEPDFWRVIVWAEAADRLRPGVVGVEVVAVEGPTAVGNPGSGGEVLGIEGAAAQAAVFQPVVGGPTEVTKACRIEGEVGVSCAVARVETLGGRVALHTPAFEQRNANAGRG